MAGPAGTALPAHILIIDDDERFAICCSGSWPKAAFWSQQQEVQKKPGPIWWGWRLTCW